MFTSPLDDRYDALDPQITPKHSRTSQGFRLPTPFTLLNPLSKLTLLAQEGAAGELTPTQSIVASPFPLIAILFFLYYFMVYLPERKKRREEKEMRSRLKKNDRIITIGGIHGTVVSAPSDSNVLVIRIDENGSTKMKINRSAVATVINEKTASTTQTEES